MSGRRGAPARRRGSGAVLLLVAAAAAGCATITYEAPLIEEMVAMNRVAPPAMYEVVGQFEADRRAVFAIASLITLVDSELEETLARELARSGGDAVINLRIHEENDFIDWLVAVVAGQLVNTRSITLRGDVIRWTRDAGIGGLDLSDRCRQLDVPVGEGGSRIGYACVRPGE